MTPTRPAGPLVVLHDHLDGGLRPSTIIDLARISGYRDLPTTDPDELATWFHRGAARRSLELYLETFRHTVAVLREPEALERAAFECGEDLAADGVAYAECRFAPAIVASSDMSIVESIGAVDRGFAAAESQCGITLRTIVTVMRDLPDSRASAHAAAISTDQRVVGFDIAGPEAGFPASAHLSAIRIARDAGLGVTIHAGESDGVEAMRDAVYACETDRIGHGVRLMDDIGDIRDVATFGPIARKILDEGIPLEMCPTSNIHTGAVIDLASHPVEAFRQAGFTLSVNTDNRLMSDVTLPSEFADLAATFGWTPDIVDDLTISALDAAFCDDDTRSQVATRLTIAPGAIPSSVRGSVRQPAAIDLPRRS